MGRVRISTTVDGGRLEACRRLTAQPDSRLLDDALEALLDSLESRREMAALDGQPYEDDPDLNWEAPAGPDLPYDGQIPAEVVSLAAARRARR